MLDSLNFAPEGDGWEGPLDTLLAFAKARKVDLRQIDVGQFVDQFIGWLDYVLAGGEIELSLVGDNLVAMAWLVSLKTQLLIPGKSVETPAIDIKKRLIHLDLIRNCAEKLMNRPRLGWDVFERLRFPDGSIRNDPVYDRNGRRRRQYYVTPMMLNGRVTHQSKAGKRSETPAPPVELAGLLDVINDLGLGQAAAPEVPSIYKVSPPEIYAVADAADHIKARLLEIDGPTEFADLVPPVRPGLARSALAATFVAALELAREGNLEIQQSQAFEPLYVVPMGITRRLAQAI